MAQKDGDWESTYEITIPKVYKKLKNKNMRESKTETQVMMSEIKLRQRRNILEASIQWTHIVVLFTNVAWASLNAVPQIDVRLILQDPSTCVRAIFAMCWRRRAEQKCQNIARI